MLKLGLIFKYNNSLLYKWGPNVNFHQHDLQEYLGRRYASFFNRSTVSIVEQLISGGKVLDDNSEGNKVRVLDQIAVPKPYVSQNFGALFTGLLRRDHMLALGLYRPISAHGSLVSYVFTNPPPHEQLELKDLVFILH